MLDVTKLYSYDRIDSLEDFYKNPTVENMESVILGYEKLVKEQFEEYKEVCAERNYIDCNNGELQRKIERLQDKLDEYSNIGDKELCAGCKLLDLIDDIVNEKYKHNVVNYDTKDKIINALDFALRYEDYGHEVK